MMSLWPSRRKQIQADPDAPPRPDRLTYVIGDVHGCLEKLRGLLDRIDADRGSGEADVVCVGDYVDRGPDSAGVIDDLMRLDRQNATRFQCLMGNHDRLMLDFATAEAPSRQWLDVGGGATLASFGVGHVSGASAAERLAKTATALRQALGKDRLDWLAARPLWWRSGTVTVVHALTDPDLPMEDQAEDTLLWARPGRDLRPRADGSWVVHGHTILREPRSLAGHIGIDTGAFRGGPLTAVALDGGPPRFLSFGGNAG